MQLGANFFLKIDRVAVIYPKGALLRCCDTQSVGVSIYRYTSMAKAAAFEDINYWEDRYRYVHMRQCDFGRLPAAERSTVA